MRRRDYKSTGSSMELLARGQKGIYLVLHALMKHKWVWGTWVLGNWLDFGPYVTCLSFQKLIELMSPN